MTSLAELIENAERGELSPESAAPYLFLARREIQTLDAIFFENALNPEKRLRLSASLKLNQAETMESQARILAGLVWEPCFFQS